MPIAMPQMISIIAANSAKLSGSPNAIDEQGNADYRYRKQGQRGCNRWQAPVDFCIAQYSSGSDGCL
jgi:hypothetical protein